MKKAMNIAIVIILPLLSALAIYDRLYPLIFAVAKNWKYFGVGSFMLNGNYLQGLTAIALMWVSFYLVVWVISPQGRYFELLSRLCSNKWGASAICFWLFLEVFAANLSLQHMWLFDLSLLAYAISIFGIIPALLLEVALTATDIEDVGKTSPVVACVTSIALSLILPLFIAYGVETVLR